VIDFAQEIDESVKQVSQYGELIIGSLVVLIVGMGIIYLIHWLASRFVFPHLRRTRLVNVIFGVIYALVLVIMAMLALHRVGLDVTVISRVALASVLIGGVVIFFLAPFLPMLPFKIGHIVEVNGELGVVDGISSFRITLRKFDGTEVFIPAPSIMTSKIKNYSDTPSRRIEINLSVDNHSNLEEIKATVVRLIGEDERVLDDPALPDVFVTNTHAAGVDMVAVCWVKNEDWFGARGDLWLKIVDAFLKDSRVALSLPQQEVYLVQGTKTSHEDHKKK
jgi:small conductance mechanosensitive channel